MVDGCVAISQLVAVEALLTADVGALENGKGEATKAADVDFIKGKAGGSTDRVVGGELDVRKMGVSITVSVVHHHGGHFGYCMTDALSAAISRRVERACGEFVDTKEIVDGAGEL